MPAFSSDSLQRIRRLSGLHEDPGVVFTNPHVLAGDTDKPALWLLIGNVSNSGPFVSLPFICTCCPGSDLIPVLVSLGLFPWHHHAFVSSSMCWTCYRAHLATCIVWKFGIYRPLGQRPVGRQNWQNRDSMAHSTQTQASLCFKLRSLRWSWR